MNVTKSPGMMCLSAYMLLVGLTALVPALSGMGMVTSILALAGGALLLVGK